MKNIDLKKYKKGGDTSKILSQNQTRFM